MVAECRHDENQFAGHGAGIIDVPTDLLKKAQTELDDIHYSESNSAHDFAMLKQSLQDQWTQDSQARSEKHRADLAEADKRLTLLKASQADSKSTCSQVAKDHEISVKAFAEGLKAMADATPASQGSKR